MNKVIKIRGADYRVEYNTSCKPTCMQCAFFHGDCPKVTEDEDCDVLLCNNDGYNAFFVAEPAKKMVEEFKEVAGIATELTFTESQVRAAYADWVDDRSDSADRFVDYLKKFSDPEYQEFLRLKEKFS